MKTPRSLERMPSKAKPKTKGAAATKPREPPIKPKSPKPNAKPAAGAAGRATSREAADERDWREEILARMRALIMEADPEMIEERKWVKPTNPEGVPVWSHDGIVCTGETYAKAVKLTFARGAKIPDPLRIFNSSLEGHTRRAIDIGHGEKVDAAAFKALIKAAVAMNASIAKKNR